MGAFKHLETKVVRAGSPSPRINGAVITPIGPRHWIERITHRMNHLGGSLDPHAAFLLGRGVKTLVVRMRYQQSLEAAAVSTTT